LDPNSISFMALGAASGKDQAKERHTQGSLTPLLWEMNTFNYLLSHKRLRHRSQVRPS
jgi:hypothetical protein